VVKGSKNIRMTGGGVLKLVQVLLVSVDTYVPLLDGQLHIAMWL
jgi:hypothetical protein